MAPMISISAPSGSSTDFEGAKRAIAPAFQDLVELAHTSLGAAAGPKLPEELIGLALRAESVGWNMATAEEAIRQLAREQMGARGIAFD